MAKIITKTAQEYRQIHSNRIKKDIDSLLEQTRGMWREKDGLIYQTNIRDEWDM